MILGHPREGTCFADVYPSYLVGPFDTLQYGGELDSHPISVTCRFGTFKFRKSTLAHGFGVTLAVYFGGGLGRVSTICLG